MSDSLKIVYFGSSGLLSSYPFQALLKSEHQVMAVVVNNASLSTNHIQLLPLNLRNNLESIAFENDIQIISLRGEFSTIQAQLSQLKPDVIITSCFSRKIPQAILSLARIASINIHPSLLPYYRGPDPIFWQIRDAAKKSGVSIHLMAEDFDAGDIIAQQSMTIEKPVRYHSIEKMLASLASQLLVNTLQDFKRKIKFAMPQNQAIASYYSFPRPLDFEILPSWDAQRVVEFMTATEEISCYYPIVIEGEEYKLSRVIAYDNEQTAKFSLQLSLQLSLQQSHVVFPCRKGHVKAEILTA